MCSADRELESAPESKSRSDPLAAEPVDQADVIAGLDRVQAHLSTPGRREGAEPFRLAEFEGDAAGVVNLRHGESSSCCAASLAANPAAAPCLHRIYYDASMQFAPKILPIQTRRSAS